jgi:NitT/TauT family transport system permease protein
MAFRLSGKEPWEFVPPGDAVKALWDGLVTKEFLVALRDSMWRILYGFALALVIGGTLGTSLAYSRHANWFFGPLVLGVQSLPSICWMPVAVLWFGLGEKAILFVVLMGSLGSITMATRDGLRQVPVTYHRVAGTFGASLTQHLLWVSLPAALPSFVSGLKQGWSFAWRSLLAGELLYSVAGVGALITQARDMADYPRMFAAMILIVCVSVAVDKFLFTRLEQHVRVRWGLAAQ